MHIILTCLIFCVVLFLYLHIQFHLKNSNELEIYELEPNVGKERLEEICDLRQPVLFDMEECAFFTSTMNKHIIDIYPMFDVKLKNMTTFASTFTNALALNDSALFLPLHAVNQLFKDKKNVNEEKKDANKEKKEKKENKDSDSVLYLSERNMDFLKETTLLRHFQTNDGFLRPPLISTKKYDWIFGNEQSFTPLRYELNYRNFFMLTQGEARIKLIPPQNSKYLHTINDYENLDFFSPINPWMPQEKYQQDFEKIKLLELKLPLNQVLYIPAYWWYSIQLTKDASVACFYYKTYMNTLSVLPTLSLHLLQLLNVKQNVVFKTENT